MTDFQDRISAVKDRITVPDKMIVFQDRKTVVLHKILTVFQDGMTME